VIGPGSGRPIPIIFLGRDNQPTTLQRVRECSATIEPLRGRSATVIEIVDPPPVWTIWKSMWSDEIEKIGMPSLDSIREAVSCIYNNIWFGYFIFLWLSMIILISPFDWSLLSLIELVEGWSLSDISITIPITYKVEITDFTDLGMTVGGIHPTVTVTVLTDTINFVSSRN